MSKDNILNNDDENVKHNFEKKLFIEKLNSQMDEGFKNYKKMLRLMSCDAPISILMLPPEIETILSDNGFTRVNEILDVDFAKIKGLGKIRVGTVNAALSHFLSLVG